MPTIYRPHQGYSTGTSLKGNIAAEGQRVLDEYVAVVGRYISPQ